MNLCMLSSIVTVAVIILVMILIVINNNNRIANSCEKKVDLQLKTISFGKK